MEIADIAIIIACIAFIITQGHLWYTARKLIKKSNDSWAEVKTFVNQAQNELAEKIDVKIREAGGSTADLEDFKVEFNDFAAQVGKDLGELPSKVDSMLHLALTQWKGKESQEYQAMIREMGLDKVVEGESQEMMARNPEFMKMKFMNKLMSMGVSEGYQEKNPLGALALEYGKIKMMEQIYAGGDGSHASLGSGSKGKPGSVSPFG